jgi:hypothetical protein
MPAHISHRTDILVLSILQLLLKGLQLRLQDTDVSINMMNILLDTFNLLLNLAFVQKVSDNQVYTNNIVGNMNFNLQAADKDITVPGKLSMRKDEVIRIQLFIPILGTDRGNPLRWQRHLRGFRILQWHRVFR